MSLGEYATISLPANPGGESQDCIAQVSQKKQQYLLVADGAGGISGGKNAANFAVGEVVSLVAKQNAPRNAEELRDFLVKLDFKISREKNSGETTLIVCVIEGTNLWGASVGDSEAWLVTSEYQNELTQYQVRKPLLGSGLAIPTVFESHIDKETLVIGTDGIFNYIDRTKMLGNAANFELIDDLEGFLELPRDRNGMLYDDASIIVLRRNAEH